jgi:hypothetical protein
MRVLLFAALLLVGCSSNTGTGGGTGGTGGSGGMGGAGGGSDEVLFKVSGTVKVHPIAANFAADAGLDAGFVGLTVRVEEPLKVALANPDGIFSTQTLDATGAFSASNISSLDVSLGVAVGVFDPTDAGTRVVRSATVVFDVALQDTKPTKDIVGTGYSVPVAFHDKLTALITESKIRMLTGAQNKGTLVEAGFILGRVVDAMGKPVSGQKIAPTPASLAGGFFYPTADLASLGTATSSNGLFIYVHNGGDVNTFRFNVENQPDYKQRNAGARKDACVVIDVYPGLVAP